MADELSILTRVGHPDFLDLPWGTPLEEWDHERMVPMAHGVSRHIVRFVRYDERVYALKETTERPARLEYDVLKELREEHLPVVEPVGIVAGVDDHDGAMLITRYLDYSLPYWYVLGRDHPALAEHLIDAAVVLLVRLHLERVFWGDCSLGNILFRRDAGALMAYLVDAETTERHTTLSDGMRSYDLTIAKENIIGGLLDLQATGRVPEDVDPFGITDDLEQRYHQLWDELTRTEEFAVSERWRIDQRIRHLNDLGFDVEELSISSDGRDIRIKPILVEEGHHARDLRRRTGLEVQENQARRLLADIANHRAWLQKDAPKPVPRAVAAARWLADVYEPVVESIPEELQAQLEDAEVFHAVLEHRYYLSLERQEEVTHAEATAHYVDNYLRKRPAERQLDVEWPDEI
ncbi:MAG: DUF4032 domain-containing protein [Actinomycetota bacterium]